MEESSNKAAEAVIETLSTRGWCLGDINQLNALIVIQSALSDDGDPCTVANSVESELLNMDLRSIGAKSLPDPILLNKSSYLHGPKILQISSVRDISVSSIDGFPNSSKQRLLKLSLTDGHNEITAIEYSHIPSSPNDIVPGSKVRLENKAPIHSCIVCLNPKVITLLGGVVQSLYEEWQMNTKYSGFSRSSLRLSQETDGGGPPPFEKLQIGAPSHKSSQRSSISDYFESTSNSTMQVTSETSGNTEALSHDARRKAESIDDKVKIDSLKASYKENPRNYQWRSKEDYHGSTSKSSVPNVAITSGNTELRPMNTQQKVDDDKAKIVSCNENLEQKPSDSSARQKEVVESVPIQNQAASQKLLQKMNPHTNQGDRHLKGQKYRRKNKQEESQVFTLAEWEKRGAGPQQVIKNDLPNAGCDEDVAWQLQNLEDFHGHRRAHNTVVDDIRMSMFNYERDGNRVHEMEPGGRGRGGRGRGKGKWRGRGRGRGGAG